MKVITMCKAYFAEYQIVTVIKSVESWWTIKDISSEAGISESSITSMDYHHFSVHCNFSVRLLYCNHLILDIISQHQADYTRVLVSDRRCALLTPFLFFNWLTYWCRGGIIVIHGNSDDSTDTMNKKCSKILLPLEPDQSMLQSDNHF